MQLQNVFPRVHARSYEKRNIVITIVFLSVCLSVCHTPAEHIAEVFQCIEISSFQFS